MLPLFVMETLGELPGLSGLFIAGVFSAALSSLSTCLNSMSAVVLEDFVKPYVKKPLTEQMVNWVMRSVVVVIGVICVGMVYIVEKMGTVLQLTMSLEAITNGPLFGIFTIGIFLPWIKSRVSCLSDLSLYLNLNLISECFNWRHQWHDPHVVDQLSFAVGHRIRTYELSPQGTGFRSVLLQLCALKFVHCWRSDKRFSSVVQNILHVVCLKVAIINCIKELTNAFQVHDVRSTFHNLCVADLLNLLRLSRPNYNFTWTHNTFAEKKNFQRASISVWKVGTGWRKRYRILIEELIVLLRI